MEEIVIGIAVVYFVPALVWATVIAGLIQTVRDKVWETRPTQPQTLAGLEAQQPIGST
jgi:hypothetical protein